MHWLRSQGSNMWGKDATQQRAFCVACRQQFDNSNFLFTRNKLITRRNISVNRTQNCNFYLKFTQLRLQFIQSNYFLHFNIVSSFFHASFQRSFTIYVFRRSVCIKKVTGSSCLTVVRLICNVRGRNLQYNNNIKF